MTVKLFVALYVGLIVGMFVLFFTNFPVAWVFFGFLFVAVFGGMMLVRSPLYYRCGFSVGVADRVGRGSLCHAAVLANKHLADRPRRNHTVVVLYPND